MDYSKNKNKPKPKNIKTRRTKKYKKGRLSKSYRRRNVGKIPMSGG
jgi:hypothetical protein